MASKTRERHTSTHTHRHEYMSTKIKRNGSTPPLQVPKSENTSTHPKIMSHSNPGQKIPPHGTRKRAKSPLTHHTQGKIIHDPWQGGVPPKLRYKQSCHKPKLLQQFCKCPTGGYTPLGRAYIQFALGPRWRALIRGFLSLAAPSTPTFPIPICILVGHAKCFMAMKHAIWLSSQNT